MFYNRGPVILFPVYTMFMIIKVWNILTFNLTAVSTGRTVSLELQRVWPVEWRLCNKEINQSSIDGCYIKFLLLTKARPLQSILKKVNWEKSNWHKLNVMSELWRLLIEPCTSFFCSKCETIIIIVWKKAFL